MIGDFLRELRGKRSLRDIQEISGVSYTYLRSIEKGVDPRSGNEILPTPGTLVKLAEAYNHSYLELMEKAGYLMHRDSLEFATSKIIIAIVGVLKEIKHTNKYTKEAAQEFHKDLIAAYRGADISITDLKRHLYDVEPEGDASARLGDWGQTNKIANLLELLDKVASDDINLRMLKRELQKTKELTVYIDQPDVEYKGHPLTDQDRKRILDMLEQLFPQYAQKEATL